MKNSIQDRQYDSFRPAENDKSKRAVVIEQGVLNPIPVEMDVQDSFNRLKVAPPHLLFDSSFQYSIQEKVFIRDVVSGATITHDASRAAIRLSSTTTAGSRARFRSRNYFPYSPAFTNTVTASFNMQGRVVGVTQRVGMYDENNGYILEAHNGIVRVGIRSGISGSTTYVNQTDWNVDPMNGTGQSGINLDISKQQILVIQYQWLGSGQVIFSLSIDGVTYPFHKFNHANIPLPKSFDKFLSYFIISPDMHKVHHHYKLPYTDSNYGNIFSVWDRLFGTCKYLDREKIIYGVDTHMNPKENNQLGNLLKIPFEKYRNPES
jgi:hypothetical protein